MLIAALKLKLSSCHEIGRHDDRVLIPQLLWFFVISILYLRWIISVLIVIVIIFFGIFKVFEQVNIHLILLVNHKHDLAVDIIVVEKHFTKE